VRPRVVLLSALLFAACEPLTPIPMHGDPVAPSSSAPAEIEDGTGGLAVTDEPFADPLQPLALTGAVTVEERTLSGGVLEIGSDAARASMSVFLNPQSPYSREFQRSRMPSVVSQFVATGKLSVKAYVLPIDKYAGSAFAARAVSCAAAQGKGYPAFDLLVREGRTDLTQADVDDLGIDATAYRSCIQTGARDPFAASAPAIERWDVTLVPTYVIDDRRFEGLPAEADLVGAITAALR
jgi:protein-disulfide isomerase